MHKSGEETGLSSKAGLKSQNTARKYDKDENLENYDSNARASTFWAMIG